MIIFINEKNQIKDIGSTNKDNLTAIVIPKEDNPFEGWSNAKICCYAVQLTNDGKVIGYYPYIDTRLIPKIEDMGYVDDENTQQIIETQEGLMETYETADINSSDIEDLRSAVEELYEMLESEV